MCHVHDCFPIFRGPPDISKKSPRKSRGLPRVQYIEIIRDGPRLSNQTNRVYGPRPVVSLVVTGWSSIRAALGHHFRCRLNTNQPYATSIQLIRTPLPKKPKTQSNSRLGHTYQMDTSKRRVCTPWNLACRTRGQQVESGHLGTVEFISGLKRRP